MSQQGRHGLAEDHTSLPAWLVVVCVAILTVGSWCAIEFFFEDPKDPMQMARKAQTAILAPAVFALQPWLPWLRTTGFTLLLWLPCFAVALLGGFVFGFIGAPAGTAGSGFQIIINGLMAFALAVAWMLAWRLSGRRGSPRVRG